MFITWCGSLPTLEAEQPCPRALSGALRFRGQPNAHFPADGDPTLEEAHQPNVKEAHLEEHQVPASTANHSAPVK
jgi:hypothetical protein